METYSYLLSSDSLGMTVAVSSTRPRLGFSQSRSASEAPVLLGIADRSNLFWTGTSRRGARLRLGAAGGEASSGKPSIYSSGDERLCLSPDGCGGDADRDCSTEAWLISADGRGSLAAVVQSGGSLLLWWTVLMLSAPELLVWLIRLLLQPFLSIWFRPDSMFNGLGGDVLMVELSLWLHLELFNMVVFAASGGGAARGTELLEDCAVPRLAGPFGLACSFWDWNEVFGPYLGPHEEWVSLLGLSLI